MAILSRRSFLDREKAVQLAGTRITSRQLEEIAKRDPSFALELLENLPNLQSRVSPRLRDDLSLDPPIGSDNGRSLAEIVLHDGPLNLLRNEPALLKFALKFLTALADANDMEVITPSDW